MAALEGTLREHRGSAKGAPRGASREHQGSTDGALMEHQESTKGALQASMQHATCIHLLWYMVKL